MVICLFIYFLHVELWDILLHKTLVLLNLIYLLEMRLQLNCNQKYIRIYISSTYSKWDMDS